MTSSRSESYTEIITEAAASVGDYLGVSTDAGGAVLALFVVGVGVLVLTIAKRYDWT